MPMRRGALRSGTVVLGSVGVLAAALVACSSEPDRRCVDASGMTAADTPTSTPSSTPASVVPGTPTSTASRTPTSVPAGPGRAVPPKKAASVPSGTPSPSATPTLDDAADYRLVDTAECRSGTPNHYYYYGGSVHNGYISGGGFSKSAVKRGGLGHTSSTAHKSAPHKSGSKKSSGG